MICYGQRGFEAGNIFFFNKNRGFAGCQFAQVKLVELPVVPMRLSGEDGKHGRLRAIEHGDRLATTQLNDRGGYRIDAQCREDAGE